MNSLRLVSIWVGSGVLLLSSAGVGQDFDANQGREGSGEVSVAVSEICNNIDDDLDGEIDEGITGCEWSTIPGPPPAPLPAELLKLVRELPDSLDAEHVDELCNNMDDDLDGEIDEGITGCEWSTIPGPPPTDLRPF
jgi:hypothetical protein